ncbi:hypothetical protein M0R72_04275 [Candidatus Pacearchaeota archaeon]|jgi:hypothetical protein|nr:hypothetical protein [Candidatus Pacearchaeota archaeon]
MEISLYFFKKLKNGEFDFYKIPISRNKQLLDNILTKEEHVITSEETEIQDYFRIYDRVPSSELYYDISEETDLYKEFINEIIINNSQFPSISSFTPRSNVKDIYPFDGFLILRKNTDSTFVLGIESLNDKLKLYRKGCLSLGEDYNIDTTSKTILIPNYVTATVKGSWNRREVTIQKTYCRSKFTSFFEKMFNYQDKWKNKANEIKTAHTYLEVNPASWQEFSKDLRNSRKFVRCFNIEEGNLENVKSYFECPGLKEKLGFQIEIDEEGNSKVKITSTEQMKNFLEAYRNHIFQNPNTSEFCKAEYIEKFDS